MGTARPYIPGSADREAGPVDTRVGRIDLGTPVRWAWACLYGFLGPRTAEPAYVTLSGVHMYPRGQWGIGVHHPAQPQAWWSGDAIVGGEGGRLESTQKGH